MYVQLFTRSMGVQFKLTYPPFKLNGLQITGPRFIILFNLSYSGCPASNINKIAMESLIIQASSSTEGHSPNQAFLSGGNCWLPTEDDNEPWLQADFAITMWLHVLETKGSSNSGQWVTNYIISYAESDGIFKNFTSGGAVKVKNK